MKDVEFVNRVKNHFRYLETEYGFRIIHESNSDGRKYTDGVVKYSSETTVIVIDSETASAALWFYRIKDGDKYDLDPIAIDEYLNTNDEEKAILLSTDPKDHTVALDLFNQKFLLNQLGWKVETGTIERNLELRLTNYAHWLKIHADLCLVSDFSLWPKFLEYKVNRARADHLRRGKDDLIYTRIKDPNGSWKLIKQSMFKDKLDYIEKLKHEFGQN